MKKLILQENFEPRLYQQAIFGNSTDKNSLVILPTGLGKTIIALTLTLYYFNKTNKKILFLAPTKPLTEQQEKSFRGFIKNEKDFKFQVLTGLVSPKKRIELYENSDFIFSTPQLIENDLLNEVINPNDFCFVIFDEAHRASGNYAYNFIAEKFETTSNFLALTASPGTSKEEINSVINNLKIEHMEYKSYDDPDVSQYVNKTEIKQLEVEIPTKFKEILVHLNKAYNKRIVKLQEKGFLEKKTFISKKDLLDLQAFLRTKITTGETTQDIWEAISISAALMKLQYGIELFESQEISSSYNYFYNFFREGKDSSKAAKDLQVDLDFRTAFEQISNLKKQGIVHPKLSKLKEVIAENLNKTKDLKIIIFAQYRDSAMKIVQELEKFKEISPSIFVGQAKKGEVKMSQKDQKKILNDFRESKINVLVSTSVGEEGLDIPKVDLVVFYEPIPSAIRTIQRIGRTGRFKKGNAIILQTKGTRDIVTKHIASAKEKRMYKVLKEIKEEFNQKSDNHGLKKFIKKESTEIKKEIKAEDMRIPIFIDNRENNQLMKELTRSIYIKPVSKNLEVGDIIIDEFIGIERKEKKDFVNSILDKRLFPQLIDLAKNYRRPLLILEGNENIFSIRNLNPNVIRATLSSIAIDLRIPIIYTDSMEETAKMIETITKRTRRDKKEISLTENKRSFSENEEIEKFVSTIPKINVVIAKSLLKKFKTIEKLVKAKESDLEEIEGIGKTRARNLVAFFKREYKDI